MASNRVLTKTVRRVQENPIPLVLIGVGVTWLAVELLSRRRTIDPYELAGHYAVYEGYDEDQTLADRFQARLAAARIRLSEAMGHAGADVRGRTVAAGRAARRRFDETVEKDPVLVSVVGLAAAALLASAIPALAARTGEVPASRGRRTSGKRARRSSKTGNGRANGESHPFH